MRPCAPRLRRSAWVSSVFHPFPTPARTAGEWETTREMSIEFEVDGPYKAMILPASTEEGRLLKKRCGPDQH